MRISKIKYSLAGTLKYCICTDDKILRINGSCLYSSFSEIIKAYINHNSEPELNPVQLYVEFVSEEFESSQELKNLYPEYFV